MPVEAYSTSPGANNNPAPNGWPEGMQPADVNNCARQLMADIATLVRQYPWLKLSTGLTLVRNSNTQFQFTGIDVSGIYSVGRRVKEIGATTVYGRISASVFSSGNTVVDVVNDAAANVPTSLTAVDVSVLDANVAGTAAVANTGTSTTNVPLVSDLLGVETIYIPADAMRPATTNGCAFHTQTQLVSGQPELVTLDFDGATQEFALFQIEMPDGWNLGTVTARFTFAVNAAVSTGVVFSLAAVAVSDNESPATAYGTAQQVAKTYGGTANRLAVSSYTSAITIAGTPAKNDTVFFRVARVPADGSDTTSQDARLVGVTIKYTRNALTDA